MALKMTNGMLLSPMMVNIFQAITWYKLPESLRLNPGEHQDTLNNAHRFHRMA